MIAPDMTIVSDEGKPFVVLMEDEIQVNLLELTNGITKTLVDTDVPVGSYNLIRVYVKGVNIVLNDGTSYDFGCSKRVAIRNQNIYQA